MDLEPVSKRWVDLSWFKVMQSDECNVRSHLLFSHKLGTFLWRDEGWKWNLNECSVFWESPFSLLGKNVAQTLIATLKHYWPEPNFTLLLQRVRSIYQFELEVRLYWSESTWSGGPCFFERFRLLSDWSSNAQVGGSELFECEDFELVQIWGNDRWLF